jgi:hypothetical protein
MTIEEMYERVFNADGSIKACGRRCCQDLMIALNPYAKEPCGNIEEGYMNVEKVKQAYQVYMATK